VQETFWNNQNSFICIYMLDYGAWVATTQLANLICAARASCLQTTESTGYLEECCYSTAWLE